MKNKLCILPFLIILFSIPSFAMNFGVNVNGGGGYHLYSNNEDSEEFHVGGGIILDYIFNMKRLLNFRFNITGSYYEIRYAKGLRIDFALTFGFIFKKTRTMEFWAGPQIGASVIYFNYDWSDAGAFIGGVAGINIQLNDRFTFAPEFGIRVGYYGGPNDYNYPSYWLEPEGYISLGLIYRLKNKQNKNDADINEIDNNS